MGDAPSLVSWHTYSKTAISRRSKRDGRSLRAVHNPLSARGGAPDHGGACATLPAGTGLAPEVLWLRGEQRGFLRLLHLRLRRVAPSVPPERVGSQHSGCLPGRGGARRGLRSPLPAPRDATPGGTSSVYPLKVYSPSFREIRFSETQGLGGQKKRAGALLPALLKHPGTVIRSPHSLVKPPANRLGPLKHGTCRYQRLYLNLY